MIRNVIAIAALIIVLAGVNWSIANKEQHLESGRVVLLELAPVDPRSLVQGDYMALRFQVAGKLRAALPALDESKKWRQEVDAKDGWVVLDVDDRGVGQFAGVANTSESADGQINLAFRVRSNTIKFATNAFFFQECTAGIYEQARFGEFRVNKHGEPLLVAMRDKDLNVLGPDSVNADESQLN